MDFWSYFARFGSKLHQKPTTVDRTTSGTALRPPNPQKFMAFPDTGRRFCRRRIILISNAVPVSGFNLGTGRPSTRAEARAAPWCLPLDARLSEWRGDGGAGGGS